MLIPCIDYPPQYAESGLYYCNINNYKKKVSLQSQFFPEGDISDLYILLPVFMDPQKGQYGPPKDLILAHNQEQLHRQRMHQHQMQQQKQMYEAEQQRNREAMMDRIKQTASVNMNYKQVSPGMMRQNQASRNMLMSYPTPPPPPSNKVVHTRHPPQTPSSPPSSTKIVHTRQPPSTKIVHTRQPHTSTPIPQQQYQYQQRQHDHTQAYSSPQRTSTPSSPPTYMSSPPTGPVNGDYGRQYSSSDNESLSTLDEFRPPLWGNDRSFINVYNSGTSPLSIDDEVNPPSIHNFPMLTKMDKIPRRRPSSRASSVKSVESGRRVMRIMNLKSANVAPVTKTPWQIKNDYNFENIKTGLEEGLGAVRGFKGEIRLSAK
jgi:hypothetical protein